MDVLLMQLTGQELGIQELSEAIVAPRAPLFTEDYANAGQAIEEEVQGSSVLVIGAAGSIGRIVVQELARLQPKELLCVDLSENSLVSLTRLLRNLFWGRIPKYEAWALDFGAPAFYSLLRSRKPDVILNFAALKHVRSEKDTFSLAQLLTVNVLNNWKLLRFLREEMPVRRFFAISTDKAANPASVMGASKRLMEKVIFAYQGLENPPARTMTSTRFANVLFSDGSLPASFLERLKHSQPLAGPSDVSRYFVTPMEGGHLCLLSAFHARTGELLVPRMEREHLISFVTVAERLLRAFGLKTRFYESIVEAFAKLNGDRNDGYWPCVFGPSDTPGEKPFEEFSEVGEAESAVQPYKDVVVLRGSSGLELGELDLRLGELEELVTNADALLATEKKEVVEMLSDLVPTFNHVEGEGTLDEKL